MEKIESIAGTKIKFFNAPDFNEVEDLVNKWIDENSKSHQYIYDIQYKHNMVLEQEAHFLEFIFIRYDLYSY